MLRSTTEISLPVAAGAVGVSAMSSAPPGAGATRNGAAFDREPSGFCKMTLRLAGDVTSAPLRVVEQLDVESQTVVRMLPPMLSDEPGPGLEGAKFPPVARSVKPPLAPAVMLDGCSERIVGCVVIVTTADAARLVSSELVAVMLSVLGEGAPAGAR